VRQAAKAGATGLAVGVAVFAVPPILGFTTAGVAAGKRIMHLPDSYGFFTKFDSGSVAAAIQSVVYGAAVPAGSAFAILQGVGATATIVPAVIAATATAAGAAAAAGGGNNDQQPDGAGGPIVEATADTPTTEDPEDPEKKDCEDTVPKDYCKIPVADPGLSQDEGNNTLNIGSGAQDRIRPRNNISHRLQSLMSGPV
jgi:hypothetical protein